jgi:ribose transport system permease protein
MSHTTSTAVAGDSGGTTAVAGDSGGTATPPPDSSGRQPPDSTSAHRLADIAAAISFRNISAVYIGIAFFVLFSLWVPDTFLTMTTWKSLLSEQAIMAMVAVGLVVSFSAGAFDLSIGLTVGVGSMLSAWLLGAQGFGIVATIVLATLCGAGIGAINAILVTRFHIDSFIATLAVSSCLTALVFGISDGQQIIGLPTAFQDIATTKFAGIAMPVWILLVVATLVWYVLEHTPVGRKIYATGGNAEAARLTGIRVKAVVAGALIVGASIAAFGGVVQTARNAASSPDLGPLYLLPTFTAAFLGSTQIKNGRFNVWGTVLAVYVLAIGVKGLQLAGAPFWLPDLFNGVALALAVGIAKNRRRAKVPGSGGSAFKPRLWRRPLPHDAKPEPMSERRPSAVSQHYAEER